MPNCDVCGGDKFDLKDGHYYCSVCQTQSQDIREEELENDAFISSMGTLTRIRTAPVAEEKEKKAADKGRPWETPEAFQFILKEQIKALLALGASPQLEDVVFQLWLRYLSKSGFAFCSEEERLKASRAKRITRDLYGSTVDDPRVKPVKTWRTLSKRGKFVHLPKSLQHRRDAKFTQSLRSITGEQPSGLETEEFYEGDDPNLINDEDTVGEDLALLMEEDTSSEENDEDEDDDEDVEKTKRKKHTSKRPLDKILLRWTLCLCYLGLLHTGSVSLASDLLRWIREGKFPYNRAADLLPEEFKLSAMGDYHVFYYTPVPSHRMLRVDTGRMAKYVGASVLPQPNLMLFVSKFILELNLPSEFHGYASTLLEKYPPSILHRDAPTDNTNYIYIPNYEGIAVCYIIILIKILFGIDGQTEKQLSSVAREVQGILRLDPALFVWKNWEEQMYYKHRKRAKKALPTCTREAEETEDVNPVMEHYRLVTRSQEMKRRACVTGKITRYKKEETREALAKPFKSMLEEFERNREGVTYTATLPEGAAQGSKPDFLRAFEQPTLSSESFDETCGSSYGRRTDEDGSQGVMTDVVIQDVSNHTVRYLVDRDFVERVSACGAVTFSRRESDELRGQYTEPGYGTLEDASQHGVAKKKRPRIERMAKCVRVTEEMKEKIEDILENRVRPHEEYKVYKSYTDSPDSYRFLIRLLSEHLCMRPVELHTLLKMTEYTLFVQYGELTPQERNALKRFKIVYFNKKSAT